MATASESTAYDHGRGVHGVHARGITREQSLVRGVKRSDKWKPNLASMCMACQYDVKPFLSIV